MQLKPAGTIRSSLWFFFVFAGFVVWFQVEGCVRMREAVGLPCQQGTDCWGATVCLAGKCRAQGTVEPVSDAPAQESGQEVASEPPQEPSSEPVHEKGQLSEPVDSAREPTPEPDIVVPEPKEPQTEPGLDAKPDTVPDTPTGEVLPEILAEQPPVDLVEPAIIQKKTGTTKGKVARMVLYQGQNPKYQGSVILSMGGTNCLQILTKQGDLESYVGQCGEKHKGHADSTFPTQIEYNKPTDMVYYNNFLLIADVENHLVRQLQETNKTSSSFASKPFLGAIGTPPPPPQGEQSVAKARFHMPNDLALTPDRKHLFIADLGNHCIRYLQLTGTSPPTGKGAVKIAAGKCQTNATTFDSLETDPLKLTMGQPNHLTYFAHGSKKYLLSSEVIQRKFFLRRFELQLGQPKPIAGVADAPKNPSKGSNGVPGFAYIPNTNKLLFLHANHIKAFDLSTKKESSWIARHQAANQPPTTKPTQRSSFRLSDPTALLLVGDVLYIADTYDVRTQLPDGEFERQSYFEIYKVRIR